MPRNTRNQNRYVLISHPMMQKGISSLGKNDKRESSQKVGMKKWNLEALKKERTKVSLLGPLQNGKVS